MSVFELRDVRHEYAGKEVLRVDAWVAQQGDQWLMLGPSGSGKTTLLHILAGILRPASGRAVVAGQDISGLLAGDLDRFRGCNIGIVLQRLHLLSSLTVAQNVLLAQYLAGVEQDSGRVREVLEGLDLADKADAYPHALSHGQAQRVAIARAVVNRPRLLLADEPNIREVVVFPMNQKAEDLMMGAPGPVSAKQLRELNIRLVEQTKV